MRRLHHALRPSQSADEEQGMARIDLTHPYYNERPMENFCANMQYDQMFTDRSVYRAPWPVSSFAVRLDGSGAVALDLTVRLPMVATPREGPVGIAVNGASVGAIHAGERWARSTVRVGRENRSLGALDSSVRSVNLSFVVSSFFAKMLPRIGLTF